MSDVIFPHTLKKRWRVSVLTLLLYRKDDSRVRMSLGVFAPKECFVLLNTLKSYAPGAAMNDLARQIKNGDVPAV
ncbi:MAG: hypothetical protein ACR2LT_06825 [Pyrinomonadaceae bacterium]